MNGVDVVKRVGAAGRNQIISPQRRTGAGLERAQFSVREAGDQHVGRFAESWNGAADFGRFLARGGIAPYLAAGLGVKRQQHVVDRLHENFAAADGRRDPNRSFGKIFPFDFSVGGVKRKYAAETGRGINRALTESQAGAF